MKISADILTLSAKITLICLISALMPVLLFSWLADLAWQEVIAGSGFTFLLVMLLTKIINANIVKGIQSLETGLLNFKDGEFSTLLAYNHQDELGYLCELYNQTSKQLRQEKQWIYQRELMLDKVLQNSPQAILLINDNGIIVYSNHSVRELIKVKTTLEGSNINDIISQLPSQLQSVFNKGIDGLFSLEHSVQESQTWHLSLGKLLLNNQPHQLYIFKQLTRELSRQEVQVWKKVIRIISHELNNSLGPISSMLHSGQLLAENIQESRLKRVFATIEERINHLNEFVQGYGKFAKLPTPNKTLINWPLLLTQLQQQWSFSLDATSSTQSAAIQTMADQTQLEQLLINLIKNAHESGSAVSDITLSIKQAQQETHIYVNDKGKGMSEAVMTNALIPFYSTKNTGSGLGLALSREIVEAHHGKISLHNREQGGLSVHVTLPF